MARWARECQGRLRIPAEGGWATRIVPHPETPTRFLLRASERRLILRGRVPLPHGRGSERARMAGGGTNLQPPERTGRAPISPRPRPNEQSRPGAAGPQEPGRGRPGHNTTETRFDPRGRAGGPEAHARMRPRALQATPAGGGRATGSRPGAAGPRGALLTQQWHRHGFEI